MLLEPGVSPLLGFYVGAGPTERRVLISLDEEDINERQQERDELRLSMPLGVELRGGEAPSALVTFALIPELTIHASLRTDPDPNLNAA